MKNGERNKRKTIERSIRRRAGITNQSINFWEEKMEKAFDKLEKYSYLDDDPFSAEALEITEEQEKELQEIYSEIEFLNRRCDIEMTNTMELEREIEDFIKQYGE